MPGSKDYSHSLMSLGAAGVADPPPVVPLAKPVGLPTTWACTTDTENNKVIKFKSNMMF